MEKNKYIDHTVLKADAQKADIDKIIDEAIEYNFATVCINPSWVEHAAVRLEGKEPGITTVIGFPLGATTTEAKVFEAQDAVSKGADEVDMVINIGKFKDGEDEYILNEINRIKDGIGDEYILKVIVETALLTKEELVRISKIVTKSNADFIKTSTGFSTRGATVEDVKTMAANIDTTKTLIKPAGGVRTPEDLDKMIKAGANRIGTSQGVNLMKGKKAGEGY